MIVERKINSKFLPLLTKSRIKGLYGGRNSGKSVFFADSIVINGAKRKLDVVCVREVQKSIKYSVKKLIEERIVDNGLSKYYTIQDQSISSVHGGIIIFTGLQQYTTDNIKSLQGFDICWADESQSLSQQAIDVLLPTIRKKDSELWFSWNPTNKTDAIDMLLRGDMQPPDSIVLECNYTDNMWIDSAMLTQIDGDKLRDYEKYKHVWLGHYNLGLDGALFRASDFQRFELSVYDDVFCVVDSALKGGIKNDATAMIIFGLSGGNIHILEFDRVKMDGHVLNEWIPQLFDRMTKYQRLSRDDLVVFIEDKASGIMLLQSTRARGLNTRAISSKLTAIGKDSRAVRASKSVFNGRVKINYDDESRLMQELLQYKVGVTNKIGDDLLDCFTYGVCIGLGEI